MLRLFLEIIYVIMKNYKWSIFFIVSWFFRSVSKRQKKMHIINGNIENIRNNIRPVKRKKPADTSNG